MQGLGLGCGSLVVVDYVVAFVQTILNDDGDIILLVFLNGCAVVVGRNVISHNQDIAAAQGVVVEQGVGELGKTVVAVDEQEVFVDDTVFAQTLFEVNVKVAVLKVVVSVRHAYQQAVKEVGAEGFATIYVVGLLPMEASWQLHLYEEYEEYEQNTDKNEFARYFHSSPPFLLPAGEWAMCSSTLAAHAFMCPMSSAVAGKWP